MKKILLSLIVLAITFSVAYFFFFKKETLENLDYVNMFVGTCADKKKSKNNKDYTGYGGVAPSVGAPFAMTQWCSVTRENKIGRNIYNYYDETCLGFIGTHQPCIWMGDYGFFTFMPQIGFPKFSVKDREAIFSHKDEVATPYYYKLTYGATDAEKITTEFTATSRAAMFRISYPKTKEALVMMIEAARATPGGFIEILPEKRQIRLYNKERHDSHLGPTLNNLKGYYVLNFNTDLKNLGIWENGQKKDVAKLESSKALNGAVEFTSKPEYVEIKIGSSFISFEQAEENLKREIPQDMSFDDAVLSVKNQWRVYFDKVYVETDNVTDKKIFFTALLKTLQYPREFSEYGRYYSAFDDKVHEGESYNTYSLWDTFRAQHPWLQIIAPERVSPMVQALVQMYKESGWLPKWCNPSFTNIMVGTHADAVIADAYINAFRDYDVKTAYEAIRKNATTPPQDDLKHKWKDRCLWNEGGYEARAGLTHYINKGYVAADYTSESASRTLEFATDDYCVAQMAKALGKEDDYKTFMARSENYRNIYNPKTQFFHARNSDGSFHKNRHEGMTESENWQYRFCVMHNPNGLVELMGGVENFIKNLDEVFDKKCYGHNNEPSHHYVYLYTYCGHLEKAQLRIPAIIADNYKDAPDGLTGNDDCGQMSAWYIYSAMGFYPMTPASGEYVLGIPKFKRMTVELANGKKLEVQAPRIDKEKTLTNVTFNGKKLDRIISVKDVFNGGVLKFD